jgi:Xaa-Pro aminopeptidase
MSVTAETLLLPLSAVNQPERPLDSGRRSDIDAKQVRVARFLEGIGCEGLLVQEPDNFAWLTSGAVARGVINPAEMPLLYFSVDQRWLVASNSSNPRIFDEELDGLGFQLKEWPWHWGRQRLLADLCRNRQLAGDRPGNGVRDVSSQLALLRRTLTPYEQVCLHALGMTISHALEATCRTLRPGETEREIAGQIAHRLLHRGTMPVHLGVAADGRSRHYRQQGFTSTPIDRYAVLTVTARKYGLFASASRSVSLSPVDPEFQEEHIAVCKIGATYLAATWPDALGREILSAGRRVYQLAGFEHEWRLCPQGYITGHLPVEGELLPETGELFQAGWAITWTPSVGAASGCDTFLINEDGPRVVTPAEAWPLKRIRIQGADFVRPDVLQR